MKRQKVDKIIDTIANDEDVLKYIQRLVLNRINKESINDSKWCSKVINLTIDEALNDLNITKILYKLKHKQHKTTEKSIDDFVEVKPSFSNTEPIQMTELSGRRYKNFKKNTFQTIPASSAKLYNNKSDVDIFSKRIVDPKVLSSKLNELNEDNHSNDQEDDSDNNVNNIHDFSEFMNLTSSNEIDDQVNIRASDESNLYVRTESDEIDDGENIDNISTTSTIDNSKKLYQDNVINSLQEDLHDYLDDFDADDNVNHDDVHSVDNTNNIKFADPLITSVIAIDKCSKDEIPTLFYTHDETVKFENDYSREAQKAELLGISWSDWIAKRTDEDVAKDELEDEYNNDFNNDDEDSYIGFEDLEDENDDSYNF